MAELVIDDLVVTFGSGRNSVRAVDNVSLRVPHGTIVGLVGESGSGKSTVARTIAGLQAPTSGTLRLDGRDLVARTKNRRAHARDVQMIFQDPYSSLNPRMSVGETLDEAVALHSSDIRAGSSADSHADTKGGKTAKQRAASVRELLELVRLKPAVAAQYPSHLSGGMRQRVAIARCLAVRPKLIVADEITSALDASVQGAVLNLLRDLQRELELSVVFITHNLAAVRYIADTTAVMSKGRIVEYGDAEEIVARPTHSYTQTLVAAIPRIENAGTDRLLRAIETS